MRSRADGSLWELCSRGRSYDTKMVVPYPSTMCLFLHIVPKQFFPPPQLSNHIFSQCFCLALGVLIGGYGPEVSLRGLLFQNNGVSEFLSCFFPPSSPQIKDPDSQSITGLNSLLGYISSLFFLLYCRLKWKSSRLERHNKGKMTSEIILFSWVDITPSPQWGLRGFGDHDEWKKIEI